MGAMLVEATATNDEYLTCLSIDDEDEVTAYLDTFIGKPGPWPTTLGYLNSEGDEAGTERVLWVTGPDGLALGWRAFPTDTI